MHKTQKTSRKNQASIAFAGVVIASTLGSVSPANAAFLTFTNQTDWEAAVNNVFQEENFNTLNGISYRLNPIDVGDFTLSSSGCYEGECEIKSTSELFKPSIDGTPFAIGQTDNSPIIDVSFSFDSPIRAFGATFGGASDIDSSTPSAGNTFFRVGSETFNIPNRGIGGIGFFGILSLDSSFSVVGLENDGLGNGEGTDRFSFDNVVYSPSRAEKVPEPFTDLGILLLGVFGIASECKRRLSSQTGKL